MKRIALPVVLTALPLLAVLGGCPANDSSGPPGPQPPAPAPGPGGVAAPATPTTPSVTRKPVTTWAEQAALVGEALDELVAAVEKGDKKRALELQDHAYFRCYEDPDWHLEAASMSNLPEEELDGKMRNVKICREDLFAQIKAAVKIGAPAGKVRELCDELSRKVRADGKNLDLLKIKPGNTPR